MRLKLEKLNIIGWDILIFDLIEKQNLMNREVKLNQRVCVLIWYLKKKSKNDENNPIPIIIIL